MCIHLDCGVPACRGAETDGFMVLTRVVSRDRVRGLGAAGARGDAAVAHRDHGRGAGRDGGVVGGADDAGAGRRALCASSSATLDRVGLVEVGGRLVGDDQAGVGGERAGERDPLALAAAEAARRDAWRVRRGRPPATRLALWRGPAWRSTPRALRPRATLSRAERPATRLETWGTIATCCGAQSRPARRGIACVEVGVRRASRGRGRGGRGRRSGAAASSCRSR